MQFFRQRIIGLACLVVIGNVLFSSNFSYARRIREPEQWQTVIYEGRDIVLPSEEWERIEDKANITITRPEIYDTLEHPDRVYKGKTSWIFYKRDSKRYYFCVTVELINDNNKIGGIVKDAHYERSGR